MWRAFHDRHARYVYGLVLRSGVPHRDVDDVFQRVFMVVHRRLEADRVEKVRPWLRAIVLRVVMDHRRYHRVRRAKAWIVERLERDRPAVPTPEREHERNEASEKVWSVLRRLRPKLAEVIILCDLEGLRPAEAAETLGIPVNTVRSRRRLAKEAFARELAKR